jgi:predicted phage-related endonuclease
MGACNVSLSAEEAARVGGSDVAALLNLSPWATPLSVYARIVNGQRDEDSAPKKRGRFLESAVLNMYADATGATLLPGPKLRHPRMEYTRASLDALSLRDGCRVADAKTAGRTEIHKWGEAGTDQVPLYIVPQMCFYAGIAYMLGRVDTRDVDVPALVGGDLSVYEVKWDAELFAMCTQAVERFWVDHVLPRRPPPVTEPAIDLGAVGQMYPRHDGEPKRFDALATEEQRWVRTWAEARAARQEAERREQEAEAHLKLIMGSAPRLEGLPPDLGIRSLTWRQGKGRQEVDWSALAADLRAMGETYYAALNLSDPSGRMAEQWARLLERHTITKDGTRPLRVTETKEEE